MPLQLVRNDITRMKTDAIVNAANRSLLGGGGVDGAIHAAAGPELLAECRTLGGCETGQAKITRGYRLPAKYVIHTVGPVWYGGKNGEEQLLEACYRNSLALAAEYGCETVAFPMISAGAYGYPPDQAMSVAVSAISRFLMDHEMTVYLVVFGRDSLMIGKKLFRNVKEYIDDVYADSHYSPNTRRERWQQWHAKEAYFSASEESVQEEADSAPFVLGDSLPESIAPEDATTDEASLYSAPSPSIPTEPDQRKSPTIAPMAMSADQHEEPARHKGLFKRKTSEPLETVTGAKPDWNALLRQTDESFSEALLRMIDERGLTDVQCYKKANVDRKLFSKIRSNPAYKPRKETACAFAVALELSLEETGELLRKAGFALSHSSKFDIILEYFIRNHSYQIYEINEVLFEFDMPLLGSGMN